MIDVERLVSDLARSRPIFHSEADFQHALAWAIHTAYPELEVRLEYRAPYTPERVHLDLVILKGDWIGIIELKYKTKPLNVTIRGEKFDLQDHGAEPLGRYDFLKDLERVEVATRNFPNATGWVVMVTNDSGYWNAPTTPEVTDLSFRIHNGRILVPGQLEWKPGAENGVAQGRERPLNIQGNYLLAWKEYSTPCDGSRGVLRSLVLTTNGPSDRLTVTSVSVQKVDEHLIVADSRSVYERSTGATIAESIYLAAAAIVQRGQTTFTRQDLLRELGNDRAAYPPTFNPTFQGMRTDPGRAPTPAPRYRGLFECISRGTYCLSEAGMHLVADTDPDGDEYGR